MSIAQKVVARPVLGLVVFGLVAIVGLYLVSDTAIDMFPEISNPVLVVSTTYSGAGPETVEKTVTKLLESSLVNINGLTQLTSTSSEGSSLITLEFDYGTNLDAKTNDIRDNLDRVKRQLPDGAVTPSIMRFSTSSMPILRIAVRGNRAPNELRLIASDMIQDRLEQIDGVASANVMGGQEKIVKVSLSQNRLDAYSLTITGLAGTLASQNVELGAGSIVDGAKNYSIRTTGEYTTLADIANTVVARYNGADVRLQDIGTVELGYPDEASTVYINGENGVYVSITKQSGANSVAVADKVYERLDLLKQTLPQDVTLDVTEDDTTQIRGMISELVNSAVTGAVLAMAILFLFLRNIKSTVIIGISIPFSIIVTLLVMNLAGLTLNMMTLTGLILGVGMIVDSSIVILENIFKYRERGAKPRIAAVLGSQEVMSSIISSALTTICVFIPIILFQSKLGIVGELLKGMIFTVAIALVSSLIVAIFLVPILASTYLSLQTRAQKPLKNPVLKAADTAIEAMFQALNHGYRRLLDRAIRHRLATTALVVAAFIGCVLCLSKMNISMMPDMNEDSVSLNITLPQGTTYDDTKAVMLQLQEAAIAELKGVKSIIVNVGSSSGWITSSATNKGELSVQIDLDAPGADSSATVMQKLRAHFNDFPNASMTFGEGMSRMMSGGSDIDLALRVDDLGKGLSAAQEIVSLISAVPDLGELSIDLDEGLPQVEVVIDRVRAANMGLSINAIANEIAAAMNGVTATTFRYSGNEYSVSLMLRKEDRAKIVDLERLFVSASNGTRFSLANFATLERGAGPVSVKRENQSRVIHVTGNALNGASVAAVEAAVKQTLVERFIAPDGVSVSYEGQWGEITKTIGTYVLILTLAILLVFGVMAGQYESFKAPLINLCTIPLLIIGVVFIYLITGQTLNMLSIVGVVMLVGMVVNNGIVLVDYMNLLVGRGVNVRDACLDAGESRLRPVLMTTLTTILGLIPMAFFPGSSSMMIQPIGLTVIGGLTSSTLITLFFIPVMYSLFNEKRVAVVKARQPVAAKVAERIA
ncbi:MAG: efflux RND transporter permease subunit [Treponema sp.]|jgi:HAE1 family hydrophobic/amphiphilic exporter-1|nr:efflux RND transporter permease subunit [Treponema sp.]